MVLRDGYQLPRRAALGIVLATVGAALAVLAGLVAAIGLERALTFWNDQLTLLPWGLSRILGITVYLGIPTSIPWYAAIAGAVLTLAGLALAGTAIIRQAGSQPVRSAAAGV
jgi:hypothetical protein